MDSGKLAALSLSEFGDRLHKGHAADSKDAAERRLQVWCLMATLYDRKRRHTSAAVSAADILPQELLDQKLSDLGRPEARPRTDEELGPEEAAKLERDAA